MFRFILLATGLYVFLFSFDEMVLTNWAIVAGAATVIMNWALLKEPIRVVLYVALAMQLSKYLAALIA